MCCVFVGERLCLFFFFNATATTEIYTLALHDALPICAERTDGCGPCVRGQKASFDVIFDSMLEPAPSVAVAAGSCPTVCSSVMRIPPTRSPRGASVLRQMRRVRALHARHAKLWHRIPRFGVNFVVRRDDLPRQANLMETPDQPPRLAQPTDNSSARSRC